jgi:hypothetical protein
VGILPAIEQSGGKSRSRGETHSLRCGVCEICDGDFFFGDIFVVQWNARHGLRDEMSPHGASDDTSGMKTAARRTGVRGERYAYWYLRRMGYVFVARNYMPARAKGEIDMIGYDGETLAFVEVRTRTVRQ